MRIPLLRRSFLLGVLAFAADTAGAAPQRYELSTNRSTITFSFVLNGSSQTGTVPIARADLRVDPDNLVASTADVTADIRGAKTGMLFATQALKSPAVLDAEAFPQVRFTSTRIILGAAGRISGGAMIEGRLTLRGVTRPLRLNATLTRPAATSPDDLSHLNIHLTGTLSRATCGATGYSDLVADRIGLEIRAEIRKAN